MYLNLVVGLAEGPEDVVVKALELDVDVVVVLDVLEDVIEAFPTIYKVRPLGPPHVKLELPEHVMLQRPSVAVTLPAPRELPQ